MEIIKCKAQNCGRILNPKKNKSGYCYLHRHLSPNYKISRRKTQIKVRKSKKHKDYQKKYRENNREYYKNYSKNYHAKNRERLNKERMEKYYREKLSLNNENTSLNT